MSFIPPKIDKNIDPNFLRRVEMEIDLSAAIETSIKMGKEMAMQLEAEKPIVRCLVTKVLFQETKKRFPAIFDHLDKLGI